VPFVQPQLLEALGGEGGGTVPFVQPQLLEALGGDNDQNDSNCTSTGEPASSVRERMASSVTTAEVQQSGDMEDNDNEVHAMVSYPDNPRLPRSSQESAARQTANLRFVMAPVQAVDIHQEEASPRGKSLLECQMPH
jgi:hypothetical protein